MIKKNLILRVTEKTTSGEEHLYTIQTVNDRKGIRFSAGAPEVLITDLFELEEVLLTAKLFGQENPTENKIEKILTAEEKKENLRLNSDPLAIPSLEDIPTRDIVQYEDGDTFGFPL